MGRKVKSWGRHHAQPPCTAAGGLLSLPSEGEETGRPGGEEGKEELEGTRRKRDPGGEVVPSQNVHVEPATPLVSPLPEQWGRPQGSRPGQDGFEVSG